MSAFIVRIRLVMAYMCWIGAERIKQSGCAVLLRFQSQARVTQENIYSSHCYICRCPCITMQCKHACCQACNVGAHASRQLPSAGYRVLRLSTCLNATNGGPIPELCPNLSVGPPATPIFTAPAGAPAPASATPTPTVLMVGNMPVGSYMSVPAAPAAARQPLTQVTAGTLPTQQPVYPAGR